MKLVSIIIPAYNVENYISQCLQSVINQTYASFECIIINDGSTDKTLDIIECFAKKDYRIKFFSVSNGGQANARNLGIEKSQGEYLCFVDSDDVISHDYLANLINCIESTGSDVAICDYTSKSTDLGGDSDFKMTVYSSKTSIMNNYFNNMSYLFVVPWNKLYKKYLFQEIRFPLGTIYEDEGTTYKVLYSADNIVVIPQKLYYYRQREGSTMNTGLSKSNLVLFDRLSEMVDFFQDKKETKFVKKSQIRLLKVAIIYVFKIKKILNNDINTYNKCLYDLFEMNFNYYIKKYSLVYMKQYLYLYGYLKTHDL